jgi:hypothetical protein
MVTITKISFFLSKKITVPGLAMLSRRTDGPLRSSQPPKWNFASMADGRRFPDVKE